MGESSWNFRWFPLRTKNQTLLEKLVDGKRMACVYLKRVYHGSSVYVFACWRMCVCQLPISFIYSSDIDKLFCKRGKICHKHSVLFLSHFEYWWKLTMPTPAMLLDSHLISHMMIWFLLDGKIYPHAIWFKAVTGIPRLTKYFTSSICSRIMWFICTLSFNFSPISITNELFE